MAKFANLRTSKLVEKEYTVKIQKVKAQIKKLRAKEKITTKKRELGLIRAKEVERYHKIDVLKIQKKQKQLREAIKHQKSLKRPKIKNITRYQKQLVKVKTALKKLQKYDKQIKKLATKPKPKKKAQPTIEAPTLKQIEAPEPIPAPTIEDLKEKYKNLLEGRGNRAINKGIMEALTEAGVDTSNLEEIDKILGVEGMSWNEVADLIDKNYKELQFEDIFYKDENTVNFSGDYFTKSLSEMIQNIRNGDYANEK